MTQRTPQILSLSQPEQSIQVWQTTVGLETNQKTDESHLYGNFNLGLHVQDNPQHVHQNRIKLLANIQAEFPHIEQIHWLNQVHDDKVINVEHSSTQIETTSADAHITADKNLALAIMTADCVPVMVANETGEMIAGIHAGWQGLAKGIIFNTITEMQAKLAVTTSKNWHAWVGSCIAREHYEVDEKVRTQTLSQLEKQLLIKDQTLSEEQKQQFFSPVPEKLGHYLADLPLITRLQLELCGLKTENIQLSGLDSYGDARFYSYRQQTEQGLPFTGRMATLIFKT